MEGASVSRPELVGTSAQARWRAANPNYQAEWRAKNPDKVKASKAKYRAKPETKVVEAANWEKYRVVKAKEIKVQQAAYRADNREKVNAATQRWKLNNLEAAREADRLGYERNRVARIEKSTKWNRDNKPRRNAKESERRAAQLKATPAWANTDLISSLYTLASIYADFLGESIHVDHIVPLRSPLVCGLHTETNLTVLEGVDNIRKGNRWWPDMPTEGSNP